MKKYAILIALAAVVLAVSCRSYTVQDGREAIEYPVYENLPETRYNRILAEEERVREEARKAEEAQKEAERLRLEANRINDYPEDLASLQYPFYYNPVKSKATKDPSPVVTLRTLFIPLGEERLSGSEIAGILASISDVKAEVIGFTGSLENQVAFARSLGLDAVTTTEGTIAFRGLSVKSMAEAELVLNITKSKSVSFMAKDFKPVLPEDGDVNEIISMVNSLEDENVEAFVEGVSRSGSDSRVLFLSSFAPASSDWTDWTSLEYRTTESFMFSDILTALKWQDAYQTTHFSVETDPGVTRINGYVEERLDFIYTKGLMATASFTLPLEKSERIAVVADFILP